jgi:DNA-binding transcriptional ArsR family regulator
MSGYEMTPELSKVLASRFKALSEPARLRILGQLRRGERTVTALQEATGLGQANLSKHLRVLYDLRYVRRRREGLHVFYRLADEDVIQLCDVMCGRLERELVERRELLAGA